MVDEPDGHIGNEISQVAEGDVKLSFHMYRNLERTQISFLIRILYIYIIFRLASTLPAVEYISQCS